MKTVFRRFPAFYVVMQVDPPKLAILHKNMYAYSYATPSSDLLDLQSHDSPVFGGVAGSPSAYRIQQKIIMPHIIPTTMMKRIKKQNLSRFRVLFTPPIPETFSEELAK
jgi:hypothetical protein